MAATIPGSESAYYYATYDRSGEALRGCKSMIINGMIMPLRSNSAIMQINAKRCMRGEDVMFLAEAVATRQAIAPVANGAPAAGTLTMTTEVKASRLSDIESCIGSQWQTWAAKSDVSYSGFRGIKLGTTRKSASELLGILKSEIGFANGIGTKNPNIGTFHNLRQRDLESLFDDIKKKQCCVIPLTGATYEAAPSWSYGQNGLAEYAAVKCNNPPSNITVGPRFASTVTVRFSFPPAAGGSKVMLFAYSGGYAWTSKDYPHDQEDGEEAYCLVPTDGAWHEVGEDGTLLKSINAQAIEGSIETTCGFATPRPEPPDDDDPQSPKVRQARWAYYLTSSIEESGRRGTTFFALLDLKHTNIANTLELQD